MTARDHRLGADPATYGRERTEPVVTGSWFAPPVARAAGDGRTSARSAGRGSARGDRRSGAFPATYGRRRTQPVITGLRRAGVLVLAVGALLLAPTGPVAQAHPLGNFTVNHYDGLTLHPDRIDVLAILDTAEIPTVQERAGTDTDGDGAVSAAEGAAHAESVCAAMLGATSAAVDGTPVSFSVVSAAAEYPPGNQGLPTTRVTCRFTAPAALSGRATVKFGATFQADRIGWREITAVGAGLRVEASDVPVQSASQELRAYPADLLASPLDQRSARVSVAPGSGSSGALVALPTTGVSWLDGALAAGERFLSGLATAGDLTPAVGALAVLMALVLGASHALLPGHGKTVMAAFLAGKQGTRRDALAVGAAVTVTHTAGVLVFGLLVSLLAAFAPVTAMRWLGVVSGLLVAAVGVTLLRAALRRRRAPAEQVEVLVRAAGHGHGHGGDDHGHGGDDHRHGGDDHGHGGHGHGHGGHDHGHGGHDHWHGHGHTWSRASLAGMGMAGGLVPSPTALLVLLGAVNLGRTWFGVALVLCYGVGMAGTLTAAGLLLVAARDRIAQMDRARAWRERGGRLAAALPVATATLVLVVGIGLALRGLTGN
jgi:nickel/cobalt transporter (NicO) family protein